jgi:hypothetical protein
VSRLGGPEPGAEGSFNEEEIRHVAPPQTSARGKIMTEAEIDETLAGSFPASDPPSWTLGTDRRATNGYHDEQTQPNQKRPLGADASEAN